MPVTANHTMTKARELQRALYVAAKRSARRRFHTLCLTGTVRYLSRVHATT